MPEMLLPPRPWLDFYYARKAPPSKTLVAFFLSQNGTSLQNLAYIFSNSERLLLPKPLVDFCKSERLLLSIRV